MPILRSVTWLAALGFAVPLTAADPKPADRPVPAKDAAGRMTVPEGFRVTLFAGEPDVVQPIAMTFDDRGRLWVVECLSYPKWSMDGKWGKDRVVILEDTDGDGTFDKKTVFLDNGVNLSGIELGFGGVWLCSSPNLVFVPDRDGDDKPDGPPEFVLDGWNIKDAKHNVFNGLAWGPDGWLYGCNGIQTKSRVGRPGTPDKDRVYLDCGVWRYHPTRKVFEVVAHGGTNPWGVDWDENGQMFITNCVIDHLWHVVPGGHYQRMYGQDPNPFTYELMGPCSDHKHWAGGHWTNSRSSKPEHSDAGGGHAHSGCAVYLGDNFPPEYRNSVFMCNIHGNRVNRDTLHRSGSGYVGKHAPDFLMANDPWFRGICVKTGPEGGLYVSDWSDTGECHNYQTVDRSNGRVYRVVYGSPKPWRGDISKLSDAELVKLQRHPNDWYVRHARRVLQERAVAGRLDPKTADGLRADIASKADEPRRLRALWALHATGSLSHKELAALLATPAGDAVITWAIWLGLDSKQVSNDFYDGLDALARGSPSPALRLALAAGCQRLTPSGCLGVAGALAKSDTSSDRDLDLMVWYALEPQRTGKANGFGCVLSGLFDSPSPLLRQSLVRTAVNILDIRNGYSGLEEVIDLLSLDWNPTYQADAVRVVRMSLPTGRTTPEPGNWRGVYKKLSRGPDARLVKEASALAATFGDAAASADLRRRVTDRSEPLPERRWALQILTDLKDPAIAPHLRQLLSDTALRSAAVRALAAYPDADTPAAILRAYPTFTAAEKADAVQTLSTRPAFALALLDAVENGTLSRADVPVFTARQLLALNNKEVAAKLERVWGTVRPASATRATQADRLKALLTPDRLKVADARHGRAMFSKSCATCHKLFDDGGNVGPELTGSQRANLDYVLENVLDPSAVVPGEYRMTAFALADGRTLTGIVKKETPQAVTVRTLNEEVTVPVADIDGRKQTPLSIMPDGLFDALKDDEIRDLVAYLASPRQVPLP